MTQTGSRPPAAAGATPVRWWHRETSRQVLCLPPAALALLLPGDLFLKYLLAWDLLAITHLVLTWVTYRHRDAASARRLLRGTRLGGGGRLRDRMLVSTPQQFAQASAGLAMVGTVYVLPQAGSMGVTRNVVVAVCVLTVVTCWVTLQATYAITYAALHAAGEGLAFPGEAEPDALDFLYLAATVGTSLASSGVEVTSRRVRRALLQHSVLAFLFNTLIIAVAVGVLSGYIVNA